MKPQLLILPGALGTSKTMQPLADSLKADFEIHSFDYQPLQVTLAKGETYVKKFARDILQYLSYNNINSITLLGYSFGGLVALQAALFDNKRIKAIYSYGTIWKWDETIAQHMLQFMNPNIIERKLPHYIQLLQEWFETEDWKMVVQEEIKRTTFLGKNPAFQEKDFKVISIPVHYRIGDSDRIAFKEFTDWAYQHTPQSTFDIIPNSAHPISQINLDYLKRDIMGL